MSYQKFTKDIAIIGSTQALLALKALIILPIITKLIGAESYGIWSQLLITLSLLVPTVTLGLPYTLVRFLPGEKNKREIQDAIWSALAIVLATSLIIALAIFLFSDNISEFFGGEKILVELLSLAIIFECLNQVFLNSFRAFQQIKKYSFFIIFQNLGEILLVAGTIFLGYNLSGAVLSLFIIRFINFLIMGFYITKEIKIKIPEFLKIKEYLRFGLPNVPGNISAWIIQSSDRYLIGFYLGTIFVGYYAPAYIIGSSINFITTPITFILPVILSKLYDENRISEVKNYLKYCLKYFLMVGIPFAFGISALSVQLLATFSTSEIADKSHNIIPLVATSALLFGIYGIIIQTISLKKETKIAGLIWTASAFVNIGLNLIFIPRFGIMGAAITTFIAYGMALVMAYCYSFQKFRFDIDWQSISKSVLASAIMTSFVIWINPVGLFKITIVIILSICIYIFLIFLFRGFSNTEIEILKKLLKNINYKNNKS